MDKSPWDSAAIFFYHSGFPHKTVHPFRNVPAVLPPPPPMIFPLFLLTWLLCPGIQLRGNSSTFDILTKLALSLTRKNLVYFFDTDVFAAVAVVEVVAKARYFLWHLNKTDSALKRIPRVGPCRPSVLFFDFLQSSQLPRTDTQCQPVPKESISMSFGTRKANTVGLPFVIIG